MSTVSAGQNSDITSAIMAFLLSRTREDGM
jgi:hypothetical protein